MKRTKTKLISSITVLIVCFAMLIGSTFAWFTDSASTGVNRIQAGNLDVELYYKNSSVDSYTNAKDVSNVFIEPENWEPGAVAYANFKVVNEGTLALKYELALNVKSYTSVDGKSLLDVLKLAIVEDDLNRTDDDIDTREKAINAFENATNKQLKDGVNTTVKASDILVGKDNLFVNNGQTSKAYNMIIYWPSDTDPNSALTNGAKDNDYNMNNNLAGNKLSIDLDVQLKAVQYTKESDSFDDQYDASAKNPLDEYQTVESAIAVRSVNPDGSVAYTALASPTTRTHEDYSSTIVTFRNNSGSSIMDNSVVTLDTTNTLFNIKSDGENEVASINVVATADNYFGGAFGDGTIAIIDTFIQTGLNDVSVEYVNPSDHEDVETWESGSLEQAGQYNDSSNSTNYYYYELGSGRLVFATNHFSKFGIKGKGVAYAQNTSVDMAYKDYTSAADASVDIPNLEVKLPVNATETDIQEAQKAAANSNGGSFVLTEEQEKKNENNEEKYFEAKIGNRYYATLKAATDAAGDNDKVVILNNIDLITTLELNKNITIDLNNYAITGKEVRTIQVKEGTLELTGKGVVTSTVSNVASSVIRVGDNNTSNSSKLIIGKDIIVEAPTSYGITVFGSGSEYLTVDGKVISNAPFNSSYDGCAVSTVGSDITTSNVTINETAVISSANSNGIYMPSGNLTVEGGEISGLTGIYVKAGKTTINNGVITATGSKSDYTYYGNGGISTGDALVIDNCNYPTDIERITVTGGTFISENAKSVGSYIGNGQTETVTGFITGGTFSDKPEYVATEYKTTINGEYYSVEPCLEHKYNDGLCEYCGKLQETWLNIENAMIEAPEGFLIDGNSISISSNYGFAWFAKQVNSGNYTAFNVDLAEDIDLLDYPWTPINGFTGTFNGNEHTISNVYVNGETTGQGYGIFGKSDAKSYKNLTIENVNVVGNAALGALVGDMFTGTVDNVHVKGDIFIGINTENGHIANYSSSYAGGIVGHGYAKISNCTVKGNDGSIIGHGRQVGGIYGFSGEGQFIPVQNCSVENVTITGTKSVGGILGWAHYGNGVEKCSIKNVKLIITYNDPASIGFITGTTNSEDCSPNQYMEMLSNEVANSSIYVKDSLYTEEKTLNSLYASYGMGPFYATNGNDYVFFADYATAEKYCNDNEEMELKFLNFNAIIAVAQNGETINIEEDCVLPRIELTDDKEIMIDLCGHEVECSGTDVFLVKSGKLIIKDSIGGGSIKHTGTDDLVWLQNNGTLQIDSGTYSFATKYGIAYGGDNVILNGGSFNFDSSREEKIKEYVAAGKTVNINGVSFTKE